MKSCYNLSLRLLFFLAVILISNRVLAVELFKNGSTTYTIVVAPDASATEKNAAKELSEYLNKVSGAAFPVVFNLNHNTGNHIFVGYNDRIAAYVHSHKPADDDESFTYLTVGDDIIIFGGRSRGTQYGVFSFLEQQIGVHWYAHDYTHIPTLKTLNLPKLNHHESPAFINREPYYYAFRKNADYAAHNLQNCSEAFLKDRNYGSPKQYWGNHTMAILLPAKQWFSSHPEYFAMRSGKRVDNGQLCLSNKNVVKLLTEAMLKKIKELPDYWCYDLSQLDNRLFCECRNCQSIEKRYGGHSGLILWAVNQVADAVNKVYPDKYIGTFAYSYSQQPPKGIRPSDNVIIRLCDVSCCFVHPLSECSKNADFMKYIREWSAIAKRLYIWDYIVGFTNYLAPFPNFDVLAQNLRTFRQYNAIGVFEEGQYQSYYSQFSELRQWVIAKLLWNPDQDVNALVRQFIYDYYGSAANEILQYYNLTQQLVKPETHLTIFFKTDNPIFTNSYIQKSMGILDKAMRKVSGDNVLSERVDRVRAQILYLQYRTQKIKSVSSGAFNDLLKTLRRDKTHVHEKQSYKQFLETEGFM